MSDKAVCATGNDMIKCWDFFYEVKEFKGIHKSKDIKSLITSNNMVCSINKQNDLLCEPSDLGHFKVTIPAGFEKNAKKVVAGVTSTAVIDSDGTLKFWFNKPNYSPDSINTFTGYANGKMDMSKKYFCAINAQQQLSCFRILPVNAKLVQLKVPKFLTDDVFDVSVAKDQICVISS